MWSCNNTLVAIICESYQALGPTFATLLRIFLVAQCLLAPKDFKKPNDAEFKEIIEDIYDFVIVGGGTAGSIVANRLSEVRDWNILLIEAGGSPSLATEIPAFYMNNFGTRRDWNYRTEPQKNACLNYKYRSCYWPAGRVLGGSSNINSMYYLKGNKLDYENWELNRSEIWNYENIRYSFTDSDVYEPEFRVKMSLDYDNNVHPFERLLMNAHQQIGVKQLRRYNFNDEHRNRVFITPTTVEHGTRSSVYQNYLKPIKNRRNLKVLTHAVVDEIIFVNNEAKVVRFHKASHKDKIYEVHAYKEIILSAGTIGSAQILLKSCIGSPVRHVDKKCVRLPVGKNLHDHVYVPIIFKTNKNNDYVDFFKLSKQFYTYVLEKSNDLGRVSPNRVVSFMNTRNPKCDVPDIQVRFKTVPTKHMDYNDFFSEHRFCPRIYDNIKTLNKNNTLLIAQVILLQPKSRGVLEINKFQNPVIKPNYLQHEDDILTLIRGMKRVMKLQQTAAFKEAQLSVEWINTDECKHITKYVGTNTLDEYLKCTAKYLTASMHHYVGTNKMGEDDDPSAVTDTRLRVRNAKGIRVIDASVMPRIVSADPMATVVMIAEKGAQMIRQDWLNIHTSVKDNPEKNENYYLDMNKEDV